MTLRNQRIAPSILSAGFARLGEEVEGLIAAGADTFVAGSAIFMARDGDGGYRGVIGAMRSELDATQPFRRAS